MPVSVMLHCIGLLKQILQIQKETGDDSGLQLENRADPALTIITTSCNLKLQDMKNIVVEICVLNSKCNLFYIENAVYHPLCEFIMQSEG